MSRQHNWNSTRLGAASSENNPLTVPAIGMSLFACNLDGETTITVVSPSVIYVNIDRPKDICITSFSVSKIVANQAVRVWQIYRITDSKACSDRFEIGKLPEGFRATGEPPTISSGRYEITALGGEYAIQKAFDVTG